MEQLGKILKSKYVSLETKDKIIHNLNFPITICGWESWPSIKGDRKNLIHLKGGVGGEFYGYPGPPGR